MSKFLHGHAEEDNNNAKAVATPQVFSENSQAKNASHKHFPTMF